MKKKDDHYSYEEEFHGKERKQYKKERKILSKTDRSKYKKTDVDKRKKRESHKKEEEGAVKRGRVLGIAAEGIIVSSDHQFFTCTLRGSLKKETTQLKNLIAVGDFVQFLEQPHFTGLIVKIEERHSILSRAHHHTRHKEQLIAVNIDQVLITTSVVHPFLKPHLIDRYIIAAKKGNMQPVIVINKIDFLERPPPHIDPHLVEEEKNRLQELIKIYRELHIPIFPVSTETQEGIEALKKQMHGKSSVFSGQSGVGKTSLINLTAGAQLPVGAVQKTGKGKHTTTTTHLVPIEGEGFCIDTPGIGSFGLWDLKPEEIKHYFSEIAQYASQCRYPDCSHLIEPECAVKTAVEKGKISPLRFASYCALMESLTMEHRPR
ncbi:MAG TPA: ribosome small subunit-dependent GTPase A [Rhabdochlamydiaceae bacterium]|nr:ribosome small subunit-dependent GTPase A [Rhabdochlamydiaceae bacterium]